MVSKHDSYELYAVKHLFTSSIAYRKVINEVLLCSFLTWKNKLVLYECNVKFWFYHLIGEFLDAIKHPYIETILVIETTFNYVYIVFIFHHNKSFKLTLTLKM